MAAVFFRIGSMVIGQVFRSATAAVNTGLTRCAGKAGGGGPIGVGGDADREARSACERYGSSISDLWKTSSMSSAYSMYWSEIHGRLKGLRTRDTSAGGKRDHTVKSGIVRRFEEFAVRNMRCIPRCQPIRISIAGIHPLREVSHSNRINSPCTGSTWKRRCSIVSWRRVWCCRSNSSLCTKSEGAMVS